MPGYAESVVRDVRAADSLYHDVYKLFGAPGDPITAAEIRNIVATEHDYRNQSGQNRYEPPTITPDLPNLSGYLNHSGHLASGHLADSLKISDADMTKILDAVKFAEPQVVAEVNILRNEVIDTRKIITNAAADMLLAVKKFNEDFAKAKGSGGEVDPARAFHVLIALEEKTQDFVSAVGRTAAGAEIGVELQAENIEDWIATVRSLGAPSTPEQRMKLAKARVDKLKQLLPPNSHLDTGIPIRDALAAARKAGPIGLGDIHDGLEGQKEIRFAQRHFRELRDLGVTTLGMELSPDLQPALDKFSDDGNKADLKKSFMEAGVRTAALNNAVAVADVARKNNLKLAAVDTTLGDLDKSGKHHSESIEDSDLAGNLAARNPYVAARVKTLTEQGQVVAIWFGGAHFNPLTGVNSYGSGMTTMDVATAVYGNIVVPKNTAITPPSRADQDRLFGNPNFVANP